MNEINLGTTDIIKHMNAGATLKRVLTTSSVTLTPPSGRQIGIPIEIVDGLIDHHQIEEGDGGIYKLK